jgi:hypothetical protein
VAELPTVTAGVDIVDTGPGDAEPGIGGLLGGSGLDVN